MYVRREGSQDEVQGDREGQTGIGKAAKAEKFRDTEYPPQANTFYREDDRGMEEAEPHYRRTHNVDRRTAQTDHGMLAGT